MLITWSVNSGRACVRGHAACAACTSCPPPKNPSKMMEMLCRGQGRSRGTVLGTHSPVPECPAQPPASLAWLWNTSGEGNADGAAERCEAPPEIPVLHHTRLGEQGDGENKQGRRHRDGRWWPRRAHGTAQSSQCHPGSSTSPQWV